MANRQIRGRAAGSFRSSVRKTSIWAGAFTNTPTSVPSNTVVAQELVPLATLASIGEQGYIARTRGVIVASVATTMQDPVVIWGIGVFPAGLVTAANFPDPRTSRESFFAFGGLIAQSNLTFEAHVGGMILVDSKGKRRWNADDRIVLILAGATSGHTGLVQFDIDMLVIPDQGR